MKEWLNHKGTLLFKCTLWMIYLLIMLQGLAYPENALKKDLWGMLLRSKKPLLFM